LAFDNQDTGKINLDYQGGKSCQATGDYSVVAIRINASILCSSPQQRYEDTLQQRAI